MAVIYEGFAEGLEELNRTIVSDMQVATPCGRAYKMEDGIWYESVHVGGMFVEDELQLPLQEKFRSNAQDYNGMVYAGVAGLMNLSNLAVARPAAGILFDVNYLQKPFWDDTIAALAENPNPEGFCDYLIASPEKFRERIHEVFNASACVKRGAGLPQYFQGSPYKGMYEYEALGMEGWLREGVDGSKADRTWMLKGYEHLHLMAKHNALGAITLDANDTAACAQLRDYLTGVTYRIRHEDGRAVERRGAAVGMLHISNMFLHIGKPSIRGATDWTGRELGDISGAKARANLELFLAKDPVVIDDMGSETWPEKLGYE